TAVLTSNNSPEWTINFAGTTYQYSIISLQNAFLGTFMGMEAVSVSGDGIATISGAINRQPTYLQFSLQALNGQTSFLVGFESCIPGQCPGGPRLVPENGSALTFLALAITSLLALRWRWRAA
ncbi:MAG TPA: hypothetical protein VG095_05740, partial [Chthoniobacterales bacterium]|nr:hypothetical protein [Chthoniobacterales bacterium]